MNWERFFIGIGCFAAAYLLRKLDKWVYPNAVAKQDAYGIVQLIRGWMLVIFLIIVGVGFLLSSLPAEI